MDTWWEGISALNKVFVCSAVAFSLLFIWQLIMTLWGVGSHGADHIGGAGLSGGVEGPGHLGTHDFSGDAFTLISTRSILAFGTLFSWAGAIYLAGGTPILLTLLYSFVWGAIAMFGVSLILYFLLRMQEQGNVSVSWALGEKGTVYINIPENGAGKIRVMTRGVMSVINARSSDGSPIIAGARVKVINVVNQNTVEVIEQQSPEVE
jgi:hypothetical protein